MPIMNSVFKIMTERLQTKILKTFLPAHISQAFCHQLHTHYHIMTACTVLHSVILGSTSYLAPQHKFNFLEASNTQSHFTLFTPTQSTQNTRHLSWLFFSAIKHCSSIKGNVFWLLVFIVLEMQPIFLASFSKSLSKMGSCSLMRTLSSTRWKTGTRYSKWKGPVY